METLDLEIATEFLLIAATLVELKARRLLPAPEDLELDEELLRFEERDLLLARLLDCKTFQDAAAALGALMRVADRSVPRTAGPEEPYRSLVPDPLERLRPEQLRDAARRALAPRPVDARRRRSHRADPGERRRRDRRRPRAAPRGSARAVPGAHPRRPRRAST